MNVSEIIIEGVPIIVSSEFEFESLWYSSTSSLLSFVIICDNYKVTNKYLIMNTTKLCYLAHIHGSFI